MTRAMDTILLQRIVDRDAGALGELYDRHSGLLYRLILRVLRDAGEAEDVLQEVFLRVWQRADSYDAVFGEPIGWLVRIARNRAIDRLRARGSRPALDGYEGADRLAAAEQGHPHASMAEHERRRAIEEALREIEPEQRVLIEHAFFLGYTQSELADKFNLPLGTVKTRIRRGMLVMRKRLHYYQS
jgi:RNA polymerase sigma-70 factor, ECF subfamily